MGTRILLRVVPASPVLFRILQSQLQPWCPALQPLQPHRPSQAEPHQLSGSIQNQQLHAEVQPRLFCLLLAVRAVVNVIKLLFFIADDEAK